MKHSDHTSAAPVFHLRGCRVSAPLLQPWGGGCRIVEWIDAEGQISRRVVAVKGRKHMLVDDERMPRQTLPRR